MNVKLNKFKIAKSKGFWERLAACQQKKRRHKATAAGLVKTG
jgi:hypothetical protein